MILRSLLTTVLILLPLISSADEAIEGSMDCEVTYQNFVSVEDGKPKSYSGIEGEFEKGDTLKMSYRHSLGGLLFILEDQNRDKFIIYEFKDRRELVKNSSDNLAVYKDRIGLSTISFGTDYIRHIDPKGELAMKRYYKGDWEGIYVKTMPYVQSAQISTFDCRHTKDRVSDIVSAIKTYHKANQ
jgi:CRISPR/Cas system-associated endoribonuclease Cas2